MINHSLELKPFQGGNMIRKIDDSFCICNHMRPSTIKD